MRAPSTRGGLAALLGSALLAGCATAPLPPPALTFSGQNCAVAPDLARAQSLAPEERKKHHSVFTQVDALTPCLHKGGVATPYVLYAIPSNQVSMIEVGAQLEGQRIFSPNVSILDKSGNQVRTFGPEQYLFRTGLYSVQFVPQAGDRYILVTADPERVGKDYNSVFVGTSTTTYWTGFGAANWTSGIDQNMSRTFSYDGVLVANVHRPDDES